MSKNKKFKVTLIKSMNGRLASHKACVRGLGLRRMHHTVEVEGTPEIKGMIERPRLKPPGIQKGKQGKLPVNAETHQD